MIFWYASSPIFIYSHSYLPSYLPTCLKDKHPFAKKIWFSQHPWVFLMKPEARRVKRWYPSYICKQSCAGASACGIDGETCDGGVHLEKWVVSSLKNAYIYIYLYIYIQVSYITLCTYTYNLNIYLITHTNM